MQRAQAADVIQVPKEVCTVAQVAASIPAQAADSTPDLVVDYILVPEAVYTRDRVVDFSRVPAPTTTEATSLPGRCLLKNLKNAA